MADKGIIFSAPMVRALLDGRKTQTRRLFKPRGFEFYTHPESGGRYNQYRPYRDGTWDETRLIGSGPMTPFMWGNGLYSYLSYSTSDRLYVRECIHNNLDPLCYRADMPSSDPEGPWRPSIHMPRWASRLWLAVTDVRVQRLQDISEADAIAEGIESAALTDHWKDYGVDPLPFSSPVESYQSLWNSLHAAPGTTWADDPWIVAVTFDVHQGNING